MIRDIERVGVTERAYYHFIRARQDSETSRYRKGMYEKREEEHRWMLDLYRHWGVDDPASMEVVYRRYAERLVGCIENVTCKDSGLTRRQMRSACARSSARPRRSRRRAGRARRGRVMAAMLWPIRAQHPWLAYMEGRVISFVKGNFSLLFARLKAQRYGEGKAPRGRRSLRLSGNLVTLCPPRPPVGARGPAFEVH